MAKFVRAGQLVRLFKQSAAPTVLQGLTLDDIWVDTDDHATYVCTAISPVTFTALGTGGTPGGSDTQVQFNDGSTFGGDSGLTFNKTTNVLTAGGFIGNVTGTASGNPTGSGTSSGTNTGDQTNISGNAATVTTNANLTGHITSVGNATVLGSFTVAQLSTAISDANISGTNTGDYITPVTTKGDINVYSSADARLAVGSNGKALLADSTATEGLSYDYPVRDASYIYTSYTDYGNGSTIAEGTTTNSTSGTGASVASSPTFVQDGTRIGFLTFDTGTTTTGLAASKLNSSANAITLNGGQVVFETSIRLEDLSDGTDTYTINSGLFSVNATTVAQNSSIYFNYTNGTNSGKFQCCSDSAGSDATPIDSGITVAADTWYTLTIIVNAAATSITYYINHTLVGTISSNIPTTINMGPANIMLKSAGTTSRLAYIDYLSIRKDFTTRR